MSLLFDSLRRGRSGIRTPETRGTQADAVLAMLGYAPQSRRTSPAALAVIALAGTALVIGGVWLWPRIFSPSTPSSSGPPAAVRQASTTQTRTPPRTLAPQPQPQRQGQPQGPPRLQQPLPPQAPSPAQPQVQSPAQPQPPRGARPSFSAPTPTRALAGPAASAPADPSLAALRLKEPSRQTPPLVEPRRVQAPAQPRWIEPSPQSRRVQTTRVEPPRAETGSADEFRLALYYHRAGDLDKALTHYRMVLQQNELNAEAHNNLGLLYQQRGMLDDSVREFQRATFINGRYGRAHNNLGVTFMRQGRLDMATAEFELALSIDPRDSDALVNLALAQKAGRRGEAARTTLLKALAIDPANAAAHYNLGLFYDESGEASRAVEHYWAFLEHSGVEHATLAGDVRSRVGTLSSRLR